MLTYAVVRFRSWLVFASLVVPHIEASFIWTALSFGPRRRVLTCGQP